MSNKWKPPKHGDDSKYIHVRIRSPTKFSKMRTINLGDGVKQVYGKTKGEDAWRPQNIMIPKSKISARGKGVTIKTNKLKKHLMSLGVQPSNIKKMSSGGSADYKHPALPCPGSKIRSRGRGRGQGIGKGKGPLNKKIRRRNK